MARKPLNSTDLDLSLTGSQMSVRSSTSGRPHSSQHNKRPSPTPRDHTGKLTNRSNLSRDGGATNRTTPRTKTPSMTVNSSRSDRSASSRPPKQNGSDDFLALFDRGTEPKIMKPRQSKKASAINAQNARKKAWSNDNSQTNGQSSAHNTTDYSVFQPNSGRSSTTIDDDDYLQHIRNRDDQLSSRLEDDHLHNRLHSSAAAPIPMHNRHLDSGIANNMKTQAMSPSTKTPLSDLENSYQNIKHKMPVNQHVNQTHLNTNHPRAVSDKKREHMAACRIQRWYRRHHVRTQAGNAALKRLLERTKAEHEDEETGLAYLQASVDKTTEDRKRIREEKARKARQQAIQELKLKREEKRVVNRQIAEDEVNRLKSAGKVGKPSRQSAQQSRPTAQRRTLANHGANNLQPQRRDIRTSESSSSEVSSNHRLEVSSASRHAIDDIFHNNSPRVSNHDVTNDDVNSSSSHTNHDEPVMASSRATKTTIETLMDTLKKLEEDEKMPSGRKDKNETPSNWLDDLDHRESDDDFLTAENLARLNDVPAITQTRTLPVHTHKDNVKKSGLLTDEKLKSIMSFLDEVEMADRVSEIDNAQDIRPVPELPTYSSTLGAVAGSAVPQGDPLGPPTLVPTDQEVEQMEQAAVVASEVTNTVLSQRLQLEEKQRSITMLQKALNQQRELTVRHAKQTEKDMGRQLHIQKDEYEDTIKRHLSFIDQLIDDKKTLSEKCEKLVKELKTVDKKYSEKMTSLQDNHSVEVRKLKDVGAAAEKLRREKWIDEKTKKIKEMTVKGLEPEIQRLIAKHKAEIKKLKSIHEAELLASDERAGGRYIRMTEELRDQLAKEKEAACSRERDLARQTYEKQMEQEEENYQSQRRRLYAEVREEKERLNSQAQRQRSELDRMQRQIEDNHTGVTSAMKQEYDKARDQQEERHQNEMSQLREQLNIEKTAWEENYMKKQETWLATKERELKEQVRRDRDREIELVISRLEDDTQSARDECERVAENRIKRIRDKYESEMNEIERTERQITEKYNRTKASLAEIEGEAERMKVVVKQKDKEIIELKKLLDRLNDERDRVSDVIRQEFTDRIVATEEENRRIKQDMAELKSHHRVEIERIKAETEIMQKAKQDEMEEVHKRVKQAIVKKEEVVTQMKQQYQAAMKRADHLEGLLEQQRKQLLHKK